MAYSAYIFEFWLLLELAQSLVFARDAYSRQPKIVTEDGHMFIYSADMGNISLMTSGDGYININDVNLVDIMSLAEKAVTKINEFDKFGQFQTSLSDLKEDINARILPRIKKLESHYGYKLSNGTFVPYFPRPVIQGIRRNVSLLRNEVYSLISSINKFGDELRADQCISNPCKHGGTCLPSYQRFQCLCPPNWEGKECETDTDECARFNGTDIGCQNGAMCVNEPGSYKCVCRVGWYGTHCTLRTMDCGKVSSKEICGHGICVNQGSADLGYDCICDQGWKKVGESKDVSCTIDVDECASPINPCSHDPLVPCINTPGGFECGACPAGYSGNGFQCADIDECQVNNGGCSTDPQVQCINVLGSSLCGRCPFGYSGDGKNCDPLKNPCLSNNGGCNPQSSCTFNPGTNQVECRCPFGFVGNGIGADGCVEDSAAVDGCRSSPCKHGGYCVASLTDANYTCHCRYLFTGKNCEILQSSCLDKPCLNGGTCIESAANGSRHESYECRCPPGFTGTKCENIDNGCVSTYRAQKGVINWQTEWKAQNNHLPLLCSWTIITDEDKALRIQFFNFSLPCSTTSSSSYTMEIYEGTTRDSDMVKNICGAVVPDTFVTTQNSVLFHVVGYSLSAASFSLSWNTTEPKCGGEINLDDHGTLSSPGSPGNYPQNSDCVWKINARPGKNIQFTFFLLDIEMHQNCSFDYLEIRDGYEDESPLIAKYCNSTIPAPITTSSSHALVHFRSNDKKPGKGFQLSLISVSGCGFTHTEPRGTISLDSLTKDMNKHKMEMICEWVIQLTDEETIRVDLKKLEITYLTHCPDKLEVYDGPNIHSNLILRWCGNRFGSTFPPSVTSTSNSLTIIYTTVVSKNFGELELEYSAVCEGTFTEEKGVIKSLNYPNFLPENRLCYYTIQLPPTKMIVLNFLDFDLNDDINENGCYSPGTLTIYNGNSDQSPTIGSFCGDTNPEKITSKYNYLFLKLSTIQYESMRGSRSYRGFYLNYTSYDIKCGGGMHTEPSGVIEYGKSQDNKLREDDCSWVISAPPNHIIQITWMDFKAPIHHLSCDFAFVEVYENVTEPNPKHQIGTRYCGDNPLPPLMTSHTNLLTIRAYVLKPRELSFRAVYSTEEEDSGCVRNYVSTAGTILSPNYPDQYRKNSKCEYTITVPNNKQIRLTIHEMDLEYHSKCKIEYLEIRNGGTKTSPLIGKYCGKILNKEIMSHTNRLHLSFISGNVFVGKKFRLSWDGATTGCGGQMNSSTGSIISPNYPHPYMRHTTCFWKISTSAGNTLQLTIVEIDLEPVFPCLADYVEIFDGINTNAKSLGKFCNVEHLRTISSTSSNLFILFRSDLSVQGRGFHLTYGTVCNRTITGRFRGTIESPNFPSAEGIQNDCVWKLVAPIGNKIKIAVSHFTMQAVDFGWVANYKCLYGYLKIQERNNDDPPKDLLPPSCSEKQIQPLITSELNVVYIHYKTSIYIRRSAFKLDWETSGCGGEFKNVESGEFSSPGYPKHYSHNVECHWFISAPYGKSIEITVDDMQIEQSHNCDYDSLDIYGGENEEAPLLKNLCVNVIHPSKPYVISTTGNRAFLKFRTDASNVNIGFHATFSIKDGCGGYYAALSGQIFSQNYPQNYDPKSDCPYEITVPDNLSVRLTFTVFDIFSDANCTKSYVEISDNNENYFGKFCGKKLPPPFLSTGNEMRIRHVSDGRRSALGFAAKYEVHCGSRISSFESGSISSEYLKPYLVGSEDKLLNCTWTLLASAFSEKVSLTFTSLVLEPFNETKSAVIDIYAGESKAAPLFKRLTGNKIPPTMVVPSAMVTINFIQHQAEAVFSLDYSFDESESCGGYINGEEGKLVSPNFPDNYPDNAECSWSLNLSPGNTISVRFVMLKIDLSENCNEDFVEIRESNDSGKLIGVYCGDTIPSEIKANTSLWILFRSSETNSNKGFELDYTLDHGNMLTGSSGQIGSPQYPSIHESPRSSYTWRILVSPQSVILLTVEDIFLIYSLRDGSEGCHNGIDIFDGVNEEAPFLTRICSKEPPLYSNTNALFIKMQTEKSIRFLLSWQEVGKPPVTDVGKKESMCNTTHFLKGGEVYNFSSPGFPNGYSHNLDCDWIIETDQQNHISIVFEVINLAARVYKSNCVEDVIHVYNLDRDHSKEDRIATVCQGTDTFVNFSGSSIVRVNFVSDHFTNGTGFKAKATSECGGSITHSRGVIKSPETSVYPPHKCQWNITVKSGQKIKIQFTKFKFPPSTPSCPNSFVMLRNGGYPDSPFLGSGKYCGKAPAELTTSSNKVYILFQQSDSEMIEIAYETESLQCGNGNIYLSHDGLSAVNISTPNYPNVPPPHVECKWVIYAKAGESIHFQLTDKFEMTHSDDCEMEFLELHDGSSEVGRLIGRYCSNMPPTIMTEGNSIFVKYFSDLSSPKDGFKATVSLAKCGGIFYDDYSGDIFTPDYPKSYEANVTCTWILRTDSNLGYNIFIPNLNLGFVPPAARKDFQSHQETYDSISITEVDKGTTKWYFGNFNASKYVSDDNEVKIVFKSRQLKSLFNSKKGFSLRFRQSFTRCGRIFHGTEGEFTSPGYPTVAENKFCHWAIFAPDGYVVTVTFWEFDFPKSNSDLPYLEIYDADFGSKHWTNRHSIRKLDGFLKNGTTVQSTTSEVTIVYNCNECSSHRGFKASFKASRSACGGALGKSMQYNFARQNDTSRFYCHWYYKSDADSTVTLTISGNIDQPINRDCNDAKKSKIVLRSGNGYMATICVGNGTFNTYDIFSSSELISIKANGYSELSNPVNFTLRVKKIDSCGAREFSGDYLTSPGFPNKYAPMDCVWLFSSQPWTSTVISFLNFSLSPDCNEDYLEVRNGKEISYPKIDSFCGSLIHDNIPTDEELVRIHFHSSSNRTFQGFNISFTDKPSGCGATHNGLMGFLISPGYPDKYENNLECEWYIQTPNGYHIGITFSGRFDVVGKQDYVEFSELTNGVWKPIKKVYGREAPQAINSTTNEMRVLFRTDDRNTGNGFKFKWEVNCGGIVEAGKEPEHIFSPGYPNSYEGPFVCNYTVVAPGKYIKGQFNDFSLEDKIQNECVDFVKITTYTRGSFGTFARRGEKFCGQYSPPDFVSFGSFSLIFEADAAQNARGFDLEYRIDECGGEIRSPFTYITPPEFNSAARNINCSWTIKAPKDKIIIFTIYGMNLRSSGGCRFDYIKIQDTGLSLNNKTLNVTLCGILRTQSNKFRSKSNETTVSFHSVFVTKLLSFKIGVEFGYGESSNCGGEIELKSKSERIVFSSRQFDADVTLNCKWIVTAAVPGNAVLLTIKNLSIPYENNTCNGAFEIYDGFEHGNEIGSVCNATSGYQRLSSGSTMTFRIFKFGQKDASFDLNVQLHPDPCGVNVLQVTDVPQILVSPNYPKNYPTNLNCIWELVSNKTISIRFNDIDIQSNYNCTDDWLSIDNVGRRALGPSRAPLDESYFIGTDRYVSSKGLADEMHSKVITEDFNTFLLCKKAHPLDFYFKSKRILIKFYSDFASTARGFKLTYVAKPCTRNYTSENGHIREDDVTSCELFIFAQPNATISLYFTSIKYWRYEVDCKYNSMQVWDGSKEVLKQCTSGLPDPIFSFGPVIKIALQSQRSFYAFELTYTTTDKGRGCGGTLSGFDGTFTSPFYPGNYRNFSSCEWLITKIHLYVPTLEFTAFDLGPKITCATDYVEVYDVYEEYKTLRSTFCSSDKPAIITGNAGSMLVVYKTSVHNGGLGFSANFRRHVNPESHPSRSVLQNGATL